MRQGKRFLGWIVPSSLVFAACASLPPSPPPPSLVIPWQKIGQLCASVEREVATKKIIKTEQGKIEERLYNTPIPSATVLLFRSVDVGMTCCEKGEQVGKTRTGRYGHFKFEGYPEGHYWLIVETRNGEVFTVPVIADSYVQWECDADWIGRIITVDVVPHPNVEVYIR